MNIPPNIARLRQLDLSPRVWRALENSGETRRRGFKTTVTAVGKVPPGAPKHNHEGQGFGKAIIVTGTPGVGKTTLGRRLARRIGATHLQLRIFADEIGALHRIDRKRRTKIINLTKIRNKLNRIIQKSVKTIVVDGHEAAGTIRPDLVSRVILLRLHPAVLKRRLKKRNYPNLKAEENAEAELLDAVLFDVIRSGLRTKIYEIDTTGRSIPSILNEAMKAIRQPRLKKIGTVNWLQTMNQEQKLKTILR